MNYITNCVNSSADKINRMVERAKEISYQTAVSKIGKNEIARIFPFYEWGRKNKHSTLKMKDDYAVSYYKSFYAGKPCVYICYSAIEYIFI